MVTTEHADEENHPETVQEAHPPAAASSTHSETLSSSESDTIIDGYSLPIPYPTSLSPSSIMEFQNCPQSFLFQYLWKMKQPTNPILVKGTLCHGALEDIFELSPELRTAVNLHNLLRRRWSLLRQQPQTHHQLLFENVDEERVWGQEALQLLNNYLAYEDPQCDVPHPNPVQREVWVRTQLPVHAYEGRTHPSNQNRVPDNNKDTILVRGIIDRLDMVKDDNKNVVLRLLDYKTGKAPVLKYNQATNHRIKEETFFQLKLYALLLREKDRPDSLDLRFLRLLYLASPEEQKAQALEYDLGQTQEERDIILQQVHQQVSKVYQEMCHLISLQNPLAFQGCSRSFCYCHKCRQQFAPGTVWAPENM